MAKGDIIKAYAEWHDPESCFAVFLAREGEDGYEDLDNAKPLRQFHRCVDSVGGDPVEARLAWAVMIHCPKDTGNGDASDEFFRFEREAQAKRVASRCNKELKAYRKGEPLIEGTRAQMTFMVAGGTCAPMFTLNAYRGKIAGT